ncbi:MAG: helix-turn-helix transcriptional regulator [Spirochaetales bacterium]|nr:helix-turn-helix transcriptional regulator [Spirochaetales bacterium]
MTSIQQKNKNDIFNKKSIILFCIIVAALVLSVFPLLDFLRQPLTVFPAENLENRLAALTDNIWDGNSRIQEFSFDGGVIELDYTLKEYTLKEEPQNVLVFFTLNIGTVEHPLDLSSYDTLSLYIREATMKRIQIFLKTFVPGVSMPEAANAHTLRHNQYILKLDPQKIEYNIPLEDFMTPPWWITMMKVNKSLLPKESFKKVIAFDIQFNREGSDYIIDKPEHIVIERITFQHNPSLATALLSGAAVLFYIFLAVMGVRWLIKKRKSQIPRPKSLALASYREQELHRINTYLEEHYIDPQISTTMVYKALGIPSSRVFEVLKKEYNRTFKQIINEMRIEEAKRLLKETDLRITDIAFNLGFNSTSYFNNIFKMQEGRSPSEYREDNRKER